MCLQGSAGLKGTEGPPGPPGPAVSRHALSFCPSLLQLLCYSLVHLVFSFSFLLLLHTLGFQWVQWLSLYDMDDLQYIYSTSQTLGLTWLNLCWLFYACVLEINFVYYLINVLEWVVQKKHRHVFNITIIQKFEVSKKITLLFSKDALNTSEVTAIMLQKITVSNKHCFFKTFYSSKNCWRNVMQQKTLILFHNITVLHYFWLNK